MQILKIVLNKYKRFPLLTHNTVTIVPENKLILILGTNGSGKSSLLKELSPLPPTPVDFKDGGSKYIELMHKNKHYALTTAIGSTAKNKFVVDGIELNPGGTSSVQKDLVMSAFKINPFIHEILTGQTSFTDMSISDRRKLFTDISGINIEFALTKYNDIKDKLREAEAIYRAQVSLSNLEKLKLIDENKRNDMMESIDTLNKQISVETVLLKEIMSSGVVSSDISREHIESMYKSFINYKKRHGKYIGENIEDLKEEINTLRDLLKEGEGYLKSILDYRTEVQKKIEGTGGLNYEQTLHQNNIDRRDRNVLEVEDLKKRFKYLKPDISLSVHDLNNQHSILIGGMVPTLKELTSVDIGVYNVGNYNRLNDRLLLLNGIIIEQDKQVAILTEAIRNQEKLKSGDTTECPSCHFHWYLGYDDDSYNRMKKEVIELNRQLEIHRSEYDKIKLQRKSIQEYLETVNELIRRTERTYLFKDLWRYILNEEIIYKDPQGIIPLINDLAIEINTLDRMKVLTEEINGLNVLIDRLKGMDASILEQNKRELMLTEEQIDGVNQNLLERRKVIEDKTEKLNVVLGFQSLLTNIQILEGSLDKKLEHTVKTKLIKDIELNIANQVITLNDINTKLSQNSNVEHTLKALEDAIGVLTVERDSLTMVADTLSPKDGLIAKSLNQFISKFVEDMNMFISRIWSYPLEILVDLESDNLDYKFKLKVNGDHVVSDISKASLGMSEIINLVFKFVIMRYMDISDYPVFLDEFGTHLDTEHRIKAFKNILDICDRTNHSQVFMISHHEQVYGSMHNSDVVMLNIDNIKIPQHLKYNNILSVY